MFYRITCERRILLTPSSIFASNAAETAAQRHRDAMHARSRRRAALKSPLTEQNGVVLAGANERRIDPELYSGTRKLIRPSLSAAERRRDPSHGGDPLSHAMSPESHAATPSSHAEAFYFQKQIQQQTDMTVVLEDGEEIHGVLEWYDRCALKLRAGRHRVLVYKSAIKYMFKTSDAHPAGTVMK